MFNRIKTATRPFRTRLIHLQRDIDDALTYHSVERLRIGLSFWLPRSPFDKRFQVVFKQKAPSEHFLPAILAYLKRSYTGIEYLSFSRRERPRNDPGLAAPKFYKAVNQTSPEMIFAYDSPLSVEEVRFLKQKNIRLASSTAGVDSFYVGGARSQDEALEIIRGYDWYFVGHRPHVPRLRDLGVRAVHLAWAFEPRWFHPLEIEKRFDILFVGDLDASLNVSRREMVGWLSRRFSVTIISYHPPAIEDVQHLGVETNPHRLNVLLNQAKLVLGSDRLSNIEMLNTPNQSILYEDGFLIRGRTHLTLGSGACYLVERHPEIQRQFEDGREIILWDDHEELGEHIAYLLAHDEERREIGLEGHRRALAEHGIAVAMKTLLGEMGLV